MCQITLANLHDERLNKLFFLLSGTTGSLIHDDGWGFAQSGSPFFKCHLPMHITTNAGNLLHDNSLAKNDAPLIGHIRQASPKVPVTDENAHPFAIENVIYVHNGKLVPVDEKKFVMEEEVEELDKKTQKPVKVSVGRSDSLIFFEHFMKIFEANKEKELDKRFVESLNEAMKDFCGKFAMAFLIGETYYVVRGKTADLHISFLMEGDVTKGWAINTDKKVLDYTTNLLSNLDQLINGGDGLYFTDGKLLDAESIYAVEDTNLKKIGEIHEKPVPVATTTTYYGKWENGKWESASNFTGKVTSGTGSTTKLPKSSVEKYAEKVYKFMTDWSLSLYDINNLILIAFNASTNEVTESMMHHFCEVIIPLLKNSTNKKVRKSYKARLCTSFPTYRYTKEIPYPWMMIPKDQQMKVLEDVLKK